MSGAAADERWLPVALAVVALAVIGCAEPASEPTSADVTQPQADPVPEIAPQPPAPAPPPLQPERPVEAPVAQPPAPDAMGTPGASVPEPEPGAGTEPEGAPEAEGLDLAALEQRLKATRAIGTLTKLALRNEIDDLLAALGAYHERGEGTLARLQERFGLLVMKVMRLVQEDDPQLAEAVARSRDSLWQLLADPLEFARFNT